MINLNEVVNKVSEILNSVDNPLRIESERVAFDVVTEGYRIDSIDDRKLGKNLIPVFVAVAGGENNPIENLGQQSKSINIAIYYPIKYKDIFFNLEDYLNAQIVGKVLNIGESTKQCLCNMSICQYGEISNLDLDQFEAWVGNTYERTMEKSGNWFNMQFTLYLTKNNEGFIFGNQISFKINMSLKVPVFTAISVDSTLYDRYALEDKIIDNVHYIAWRRNTIGGYEYRYTIDSGDAKEIAYYMILKDTIKVYSYDTNEMVDTGDTVDYTTYNNTGNDYVNVECDLVRANVGTGANVSPIAEQRIGVDSYAKNVANITNFNKSMLVYPKLTENFWYLFMTFYNLQLLEYISELYLTKDYGNGLKFEYSQIALDIKENADLGSPLTFTLTLGDKKDE